MSSLTYRQNGDYQIPNLSLSDQNPQPLTKYGRMRKTYLKEHRPVIYNVMLLSGDLFSHLAEVDQRAKDLHDRLLNQIKAQAGINEELKMRNQMAWVQQMNAIDAQVREIINEELIYT